MRRQFVFNKFYYLGGCKINIFISFLSPRYDVCLFINSNHDKSVNCVFSISVLIVCSPLISPATNRIINQYKHYQHTKILLIDIIGNVFSFENRFFYKSLDANERDDLLVLTILTQKSKHILYNKYQLEFSRYLSLKSSSAPQLKHSQTTNESFSDSFCDLVKQQQHNSSHYESISNNFTSCQSEIKERCSNYTNDEIKSICMSISRRMQDEHRLNDIAFNKQLVYSEHFNLFDFITSMIWDEKNVSNHERHHQFDFIVLDFKSILNASNESIASWRPLMILEQNVIDRTFFTMHRALTDNDAFDKWIPPWECSTLCWSIIAGIVLIVISLICISSLSAGIAARWGLSCSLNGIST